MKTVTMKANSYLEINLETILENTLEIKKEIGEKTKLIPVLKSNAYGLGAVSIAKMLVENCAIDMISVSHAAEGVELREAGITCQIMTMSIPLDWQVREEAEFGLIIPFGSFRQFEVLKKTALELHRKVEVQIKLDTGLHRIGFTEDEIEQLCRLLLNYRDYIEIVGTFSHFYDDSPENMKRQAVCFQTDIEKIRRCGINPGICHISSSSSIEASDLYHFDAVRIGRRLYFDNPDKPAGRIREAASFRAYLTDIRLRKAGETLGYSGEFTLKKDCEVGVLSIGYGDGLNPALAKAKAPVLINGSRATLLCTCMDQSFVDLDGIACQPGDEVTLFGYDGAGNLLSSQMIASLVGNYEGCGLTNALTPRVERLYI